MTIPEGFLPGDFYKTPEGYVIFTEQYLRRRGYCCKNACKHCPYGFNPKTGMIDRNYINPNNKN
ncbi:MAG: DUF5522 domain-containing protein [Bacteroidetes bacterium]|jgi:hypothetical protein|nr:DUF5522 domain-containing protein [Bacteroidota bacterium]